MENEILKERIGFRLTTEELRQIQRLAVGKRLKPGPWCREAVRQVMAAIRVQASRAQSPSAAPASANQGGNQTQVGQVQRVELMTTGERVLFHEVIRLRWFLQESLRYIGKGALTPENWNHIVNQVNKIGGYTDEIAHDWLVQYGVLKPKPKN
jgi:hypothetical protein